MDFSVLVLILEEQHVGPPLLEVVEQIHSSFVKESLPGDLVELSAEEVGFGSKFLSLFASELDLKTWLGKVIVSWDLVVELEESAVHVVSGPEEKGSTVILPDVRVVEGSIIILV